MLQKVVFSTIKMVDHAEENAVLTSEAILLSIAALYVILLLSYLLQRRKIRFIHETIVSVVLGMCIGLILLFVDKDRQISKMVSLTTP